VTQTEDSPPPQHPTQGESEDITTDMPLSEDIWDDLPTPQGLTPEDSEAEDALPTEIEQQPIVHTHYPKYTLFFSKATFQAYITLEYLPDTNAYQYNTVTETFYLPSPVRAHCNYPMHNTR
jgi:hypothetical protein